ncbi:MAG: hypothetical protein AAB535_02990 [Patescibacteria group bacterium]
MHAFLIIGNTGWEELAQKLKAKILEFPLKKIEDVRELNNLIRLSFSEPTLIICENINEATEEALNAFLKNLEEPQENIYFALTASNVNGVLSTIVSRCQIIKINNLKFKIYNEEEVKKFLNLKTAQQKIEFFDIIKDRNEAIKFIESLIFYFHEKGELKNMEILLETRTCLKANGNVNLHLTNLAIKYA